jgi:hypothetical protein
MVNGPNVAYQPAVAYQGGTVNTPQQEPKSDRTQPIQAAAADSQSGDDKHSAQDSADRGKVVDVQV